MKALIIEDDKSKLNTIKNHLIERGVHENDIFTADCISEFNSQLQNNIDIFIIDIRIPNYKNGPEQENGRTIIESIIGAQKGGSQLIAISSFPSEFTALRSFFERHGCILADYQDTESWKSTLDHLLIQANKNSTLDFLIFCALEEEIRPYYVLTKDGKQINRGSFTTFDFSIGTLRGAAVLLPKMGLVNATAISSVCIDRYKPKIVAMSGICGGFKDRAKLGQLLIAEMAYEYQSGKWTTDGFSQEPYQTPVSPTTIAALREILNDEELLNELETGFKGGHRPAEQNNPKLGIFSSGSAVIADKKYIEQISTIHRKVQGLDMEIFGIMRSAQILGHNPHYLCAKVVVDLADENKNDYLHAYGSYLSAKFILKAIRRLN